MTEPLHALSLTAVAEGLAAGDLTARQVVDDALDRCRTLAPRTNAIITLMEESAVAAAGRADAARDAGKPLGPLHGVPVTIKDIFDIEGFPTTAGMPARRHHLARVTATVVERIEAAGAIVIGKANVAEGVYGNYLEPYGEPINPWSAAHWAGASSGGSGVAAAACLGYGSIGSDTGGSIRMPCSVNGVTGLKPTWGRVSRHAVFELSGTLDHMGPLARSAEDAARLYAAIAGRDDRDPTSLMAPVENPLVTLNAGVAGMRIGRPSGWIANGVDAALLAAEDAVLCILEELGAVVVDIEMPDDTGLVADWFDVASVQTAVVHEDLFARHGVTYSDALARGIRHGQGISAMRVQKAQNRRTDFTGRVRRIFDHVDAVLLPVLPFRVPTRAGMAAMDAEMIFALHRFVCPFTMSGSPSVAFPAGFDGEGLPLGLQLVGPHLGEAGLLRAVHAFQSASDHHRMMPSF